MKGKATRPRGDAGSGLRFCVVDVMGAILERGPRGLGVMRAFHRDGHQVQAFSIHRLDLG